MFKIREWEDQNNRVEEGERVEPGIAEENPREAKYVTS
jgi:hypothetical protein